MRHLVVCVLAALWSSPLSASAQDEGSTPNRSQPQSEPAQEAPAPQLELDAAGVSVVPLVVAGLMMTAGTVGNKCFFNSEAPKGCNRLLYGGVGLAGVRNRPDVQLYV